MHYKTQTLSTYFVTIGQAVEAGQCSKHKRCLWSTPKLILKKFIVRCKGASLTSILRLEPKIISKARFIIINTQLNSHKIDSWP